MKLNAPLRNLDPLPDLDTLSHAEKDALIMSLEARIAEERQRLLELGVEEERLLSELGASSATEERLLSELGAFSARQPIHRGALKVGRNDPCPCGSGKKYKKCCATNFSTVL